MAALMSPLKRRSRLPRVVLIAAVAALALVFSGWLAVRAVGWWIDSSDQPVKSDIIVVLSGDYARAMLATSLYAQGYAPEVWFCSGRRDPGLAKLEAIGIHVPTEETIYRRILVTGGVPESRIRMYGRDVNSTAAEGEALRREFPSAGKKILIVTTRFHARRARLTFGLLLPGAEVRVVAAPFNDANTDWWTNKEYAENAVMETVKTLYFILGGRMK